jgi:ABC-type multidrug transport system ATPase subunit
LISGERRENSLLRLGIFTQDLAQELDANARAVDLVAAYAREGESGDIAISDQEVRSALGRLGLQGEKSLRKVAELSGGEKARVALAMFALRPSNTYLLDEVSNHLDSECVEALGVALCEWGDDKGAIVVVSHDDAFCKLIDFTHVAIVSGGKLIVEQRGARSSDWAVSSLSALESEKEISNESDSVVRDGMDSVMRKQAFNAPKRIAKIENLIEEAEKKIATLDKEMLANGTDLGKLVDLSRKKASLEAKVVVYLEEWEQLEFAIARPA